MSIRNRIDCELKRIDCGDKISYKKNKKDEFSEQIENDAGIKKHQRRNGDL